jgi:hypothetical protein
VTDVPEIFRGHFEECVQHLGGRLAAVAPRGSKRAARARMPLATFCGICEKSVSRWFRDGQMPNGLVRVRLQCALLATGYVLIDLEHAPAWKRQLVELVGYGFLAVPDAVAAFGYRSPNPLFRIALGPEGTSDAVQAKIWELWKTHKDALELRRQEAAAALALAAPAKGGPRHADESLTEGPRAVLDLARAIRELAAAIRTLCACHPPSSRKEPAREDPKSEDRGHQDPALCASGTQS